MVSLFCLPFWVIGANKCIPPLIDVHDGLCHPRSQCPEPLQRGKYARKEGCANKIEISFYIVFDCPGDGTCSNQGTCDGTTGTCVCFKGFERSSGTCKGRYKLFLDYQIVEYGNSSINDYFQMFHALV